MIKRCIQAVGIVVLCVVMFGIAELCAFTIDGNLKSVSCYTVEENGVQYIPFLSFCEAFDVTYDWQMAAQKLVVHAGNKSFSFLIGEPIAAYGTKIVNLKGAPHMANGELVIPIDVLTHSLWRVAPKKEKPKPKPLPKPYIVDTIMLDPGHGGENLGGVSWNGRVTEKECVLAVCKQLRSAFTKAGFQVLMTRENDTYVSLEDRALKTNSSNADIFISVHTNAHSDEKARGFEVFHITDKVSDVDRARESVERKATPGKGRKKVRAKKIQKALKRMRKPSKKLAEYVYAAVTDEKMFRERGIKRAQYRVLKYSQKPAVLVELGFLTNPSDCKLLSQNACKTVLVNAIVEAVQKYKKWYEAKYE